MLIKIAHLIIVDDHPIMRNGLSSILNTYPDIEVVAKAMDGETAVQRVGISSFYSLRYGKKTNRKI